MERAVLRFLYDRPLRLAAGHFRSGGDHPSGRPVDLLTEPADGTRPHRRLDSWSPGSTSLGGGWSSSSSPAAVVIGVSQFLVRTSFGLHARATVVNPALAETIGHQHRVRYGPGCLPWARPSPGWRGRCWPRSAPQPPVRIALSGQLVPGRDHRRQGSLRGLVLAGIVLGGSLAVLQFVTSTVFAQIIILAIAIIGVRIRPVLGSAWEERKQRRLRPSAGLDPQIRHPPRPPRLGQCPLAVTFAEVHGPHCLGQQLHFEPKPDSVEGGCLDAIIGGQPTTTIRSDAPAA